MSVISIIIIAIGLSMDAFAVAVAVSMTLERVTGRHVFRFAFHFGLFQAMMPVLGWLAGRSLGELFVTWDHWIAFALLTGIGLKAIIEGLKPTEERDNDEGKDATRGMSLVLFSVATSIDAFAVGLSLAMLQVDIWRPVLIIGLTTGFLTIIGMRLGERIGERFSHGIEVIGGLILCGIGIKILIEHLFQAAG